MKKYIAILFIFAISSLYSQTIEESEIVYPHTEVDKRGEIEKIYKYIEKKFIPPDQEGLRATVIVDFILEKDGTTSNINVIQDPGYGAALSLAKLVHKLPKWQPATKDGLIVRTLYTIIIKLKQI